MRASALCREVLCQPSPLRDVVAGKKIAIDALMSGYAVFQLKSPSLFAFDKTQKIDDTTAGNLSKIFHHGRVSGTFQPTPLRT